MSKKDRPRGASAKTPRDLTIEPAKSAPEPPSATFENLRDKIQARLQAPKHEIVKEKPKKENAGRASKPEKKDKPASTDAGRGKKRDRDGKVLNKVKKDEQPSREQPRPRKEEEEDDVLRTEVEALGGTAEDLELLAGAESDSELEGSVKGQPQKSRLTKTDNGGLDKGMKNILKEIALAQGDLDLDQDSLEIPEEEEDGKGDMAEGGTAQTVGKSEISDKKQRGKRQTFLCEPKPDWFSIAQPVVNTDSNPKYTLSRDNVQQLHDYATSLLEEENQKYKDSQQSSSSQSFYNTVIASGTLSDKISALTLAVQESPLHNVRALESLIGLARKRSRSQAVDVLRALKDLFAQGSMLPESRKLYAFQSQPTLLHLFSQTKTWNQGDKLPHGLDQTHLIVWAFESWLKEQYFEVLQTLEVWCNDEIEFSKARAVGYVFELLKERPEQESNLLRLLINKLGDPVKKIASQASYLLMQLLISHPAMKEVVISAIEGDFLFRPGQSLHGKYYAVVTLNQTALSAKEESVAAKLLDIYFGLFTGLLKTTVAPEQPDDQVEEEPRQRARGKKNKKPQVSGQAQTEELREKLVSAILTGVNRAYPYVGAGGTAFSDHLETLFKITHSSNFNTSIQAMLLIQQLSTTHKASNDRFYRVLYESMLDPRLITASKQQMYLNLLHRALKADLNMKRVKAFVKRLVQILSLHEPSFICGAFFLIQDLQSTFPSLAGLIGQPEDHDDDEENFRDVDEDAAPAVADNVSGRASGNVYDGHKRAPEYSNADNSCVWEMLPFLAHFHPSVSVSADNVLRHAKLPGKPDLSLHTLSHFLDRFVYRNPKLSSSGLRGSSIMQPMANDTRNVLIGGNLGSQRRLPVNSEAFREKSSDQVAAEEVFFHQYFSSLGKSAGKKAKGQKNAEAEDEESADEDEVWKAMMDSAPDLEGAEASEDDDDLSELGSEMDASEGEGAGGSDDEGVDIDPDIFAEDEDDLMEVDEVSGSDASEFGGFDSAGEGQADGRKKAKTAGKADQEEKNAKKGKKAKRLPTFASVEDYAKMLEDDEDEDVGMR